ncbi:4Fe-4S binding protein [Leadbettera azotonutricia]|uniref:4Fe-4S ferredoxin, iron-sulfur binding domain protein n=1 Tax=Leadbettera azotonutricia (strain ATCC BAA-888 / DSM 13862 / ZAS-9) TaxID=545695 RepID=F5YF10_LEAAZ|nr:4Fe-4S binding protein [Leadbettera azotonutricia]AEF82380.1 4Fe-4S ferredoxin, iron-sulfur binding domain protein [Leadbettera azotonutricia ZAS-9]
MEKAYLEKALGDLINTSPGNYITRETALRPDLAGMRIFDEPLIGYAAAGDPYFAELKKPGIIGSHFMAPREWLDSAETVIALFLPFTEQVKAANRKNPDWPADEWLHARIEGQAFQNTVCRHAIDLLKGQGFAASAPMIDSRFSQTSPVTADKNEQGYYTSNWSERHAAYVCGLGTFGLSKGLITRRGIAGRYISFITSARFEPDQRPYTGVYDYCSRCGACVRNCPAKAISLETGKSHPLCSAFVESTRKKHAPRYGCGKCQVAVPCESGIPLPLFS